MSGTTDTKKKGKSKLVNRVESSIPITEIKIDDLIMPLHFLERDDSDNYVRELASSIVDQGLLNPVTVKKVKNQYRILAGAHRWLACDLLGMETIPCRIIKVTKAGELMMTLAENINRRDVNPVAIAEVIVELMAREKLTQEAVGEKFGKSRQWIQGKLKLLESTETVKEKVKTGEISESHAVEIARLPTPELQDAALAKVEARGMGREATREMVDVFQEEQTLEPEAKAHEIAEAAIEKIDEPIMLNCSVGDHPVEIGESCLVRLCAEHFELLKQLFMKEGIDLFRV